MNRRSLLKRIAAIAAAVAVAPVVKAEAAPEDALRSGQPFDPDASMASLTPEMRAEVLRKVAEYRGSLTFDGPPRTVRQPAPGEYWCTEHLTPTTGAGHWHPLTFEAMQADCHARGCALTQEGPMLWRHARIDPKTLDGEVCHHTGHSYEGVEAWRHSLHEQHLAGYVAGSIGTGPAIRLTRLT